MKVLVTGANGFLGFHVVKKLLHEGHEVFAMVHRQGEALGGLRCKMIQADLLDYDSFKKIPVDIAMIVHVAGAMSSSPKERKRLFEVNVEGVKNIVKLVRERKCKLIHISSCVAIGANTHASDPVLTEDSFNITVGKKFSNYDSKRLGEDIVLSAARSGEITACVLNPGLIYGPGDARKPIRKGNIKAAKGKLPFFTEGGVSIVHVDDVCAAIVSAISNGRNGERYLITGDNITIKDLLTSISEEAHARSPHKVLPTMLLKFLSAIHDFLGLAGELTRENIFSATSFHWYDHSKAERELNFRPRSYQEAIRDSVHWMKENHYLDS